MFRSHDGRGSARSRELLPGAGDQNKEHGTYEFYFKAPNLRFSSKLTDKKLVIALHGCDVKVSWYIDAYLKRSEFKPKPGSEYDCEKGLEPIPSHLRQA